MVRKTRDIQLFFVVIRKGSLMFSCHFHFLFCCCLNTQFISVTTLSAVHEEHPDSLTPLCGCLCRHFLASSRSRIGNKTFVTKMSPVQTQDIVTVQRALLICNTFQPYVGMKGFR